MKKKYSYSNIFYRIVIFLFIHNLANAQTDLMGISTYGGNQFGTIFQYATGTNSLNMVYKLGGLNPGDGVTATPMKASNGNIYGLRSSGGVFGNGVLFEFNPISGQYTIKYNFDNYQQGAIPIGELVEYSAGILYGYTRYGGANDLGVIFMYNLNTGTYSKLVDFDASNIGYIPVGGLLNMPSGKMYGVTSTGGANYVTGTLFEFNPATNAIAAKITFTDSNMPPNNAQHPSGGLTLASNGKLYGLSSDGGSGAIGAIYEYDISTNSCQVVFNFSGNGSVYGQSPVGKLVQISSGKLYGVTASGGTGNSGVIFEFDPTTYSLTVDYNFYGTSGTSPNEGLTLAPDGNLYGATGSGGAYSKGTFYKLNPGNGSFSKLVDFNQVNNGAAPVGRVIQVNSSRLIGVTSVGGAGDKGVIYDYNIVAGTLTKLADLSFALNGEYPQSSLLKASNGKYYGLTYSGGMNNGGVLFEFDNITGTYTKKADFDYSTNSQFGYNPIGALMEAVPGKLYGVAQSGGPLSQGAGTIFEYDINTALLTTKYTFGGPNYLNGSGPFGPLLKSSNGKIYGVTDNGGLNQTGVLFEFNITTGTLTKVVDFPAGQTPMMPPIEAPDGSLIGLSNNGSYSGSIYKYIPATNTFSTVSYMGSTVGGNITGQLTMAPNGYFYGTTMNGGAYGGGVIFSYDYVTNSRNKVYDFPSDYNVQSNLTLAPDGYLYGLSGAGGSHGQGTLFKFDPSTVTFSTLVNFDGLNGRASTYTQLSSPCPNSFAGQPVNGPSSLCQGSGNMVIYQVPSGAISYTWTVPVGATINSGLHANILSVNLSSLPQSTYTLSVSSTYTCGIAIKSVKSFTITPPATPLPTLATVGSGSVCLGTSITFTASGTPTYTWSSGATSPTLNIIPAVTTTYTVMGTDLNNCLVSSTANVTVNSNCTDVWPGDANSDGIADNTDILELGLHFNQAGPQRAAVSNLWQSCFASNWSGIITNGKNLSHADCNGDGVINANDTAAVALNYNQVHAFKPQSGNNWSILTVSPDQPNVSPGSWGTSSVYLGDQISQLSNINGIAFSVLFDQTLIDADSVYMSYPISFFNTNQQNLNFTKKDFSNGVLYTASTHTTNIESNGYGKVASIHYKVKSSISSDTSVYIDLANAVTSNASGQLTQIVSGIVKYGENPAERLVVYPNPAGSYITVSGSLMLQKIEIQNVTGLTILSDLCAGKQHTINLEQLASGIYFVSVYAGDRIVKRQKIVVQK
ncbi:MAG: T9SS type A sorting domain-containing protein [Bacteroidetes bacterium]|nr:T9SS type A sorting domain-containing protein [Bacteroidota bacterium]